MPLLDDSERIPSSQIGVSARLYVRGSAAKGRALVGTIVRPTDEPPVREVLVLTTLFTT